MSAERLKRIHDVIQNHIDAKDLAGAVWRRIATHSSPYGQETGKRDKTSLDIFWLKDKSLTDLDNLPEPDELAEEIIENLESGLNSFRAVMRSLSAAPASSD